MSWGPADRQPRKRRWFLFPAWMGALGAVFLTYWFTWVGFVVLIGANVPSVLAEICFISNPQEERLIKNPQNRQAIAESLFEGVRSYSESLSRLKTPKSLDKGQE